MSAHTPGPWVIRKGDEWTLDVVTDHGELPDGNRNYWSVASVSTRREECIDNLRLIAAAPDLFDALCTLMDECGIESDDALAAWDKARAAIAKATGGEA